MEKFWELVRDGILIQGIIALAAVGAIIYLAVTGQPVPEVLVSIASAIIGYYFASAANARNIRQVERALQR